MIPMYITAAAYLAGTVIGFGMAWNVQAWRMESDIADLRASYSEAARSAEASARTKEQEFNTALTVTEQKASDEKKRLSVALAAANRELRNRPERPSGDDLRKGPTQNLGCTGATLYRADAEFLIGESYRADQLRINLAACQAAYDSAVKLTAP